MHDHTYTGCNRPAAVGRCTQKGSLQQLILSPGGGRSITGDGSLTQCVRSGSSVNRARHQQQQQEQQQLTFATHNTALGICGPDSGDKHIQ